MYLFKIIVLSLLTICINGSFLDKLTVKLLQASRKKKIETIVFSPLSISLGYGQLLGGTSERAREVLLREVFGGETRQKVVKELQKLWKEYYTNITEYCLLMDTKVMVKDNIEVKEGFSEYLEINFNKTVEKVPFDNSTVTEINEWAKKLSHTNSQDLISAFSDGTLLSLMNGLYFKSIWNQRFRKKKSKRFFQNHDGSTARVLFMEDERRMQMYFTHEYMMARFPVGPGIDIYILLPDLIGSVSSIISGIDTEKLPGSFKGFEEKKAILSIPKLNITVKTDLKDFAVDLGISRLYYNFDDFKPISETKMHLSNNLHQATLSLDEETRNENSQKLRNENRNYSDYMRFLVERPFVFFIRDEFTGAILLAGYITKITNDKDTLPAWKGDPKRRKKKEKKKKTNSGYKQEDISEAFVLS